MNSSSALPVSSLHSTILSSTSPISGSSSYSATSQEKEGSKNIVFRHTWQWFLANVLGDSSGRETISRVTGGMKVKADRDESSPYAAMLAAQDVAARCKELGITALHVKIRATGGKLQRSVIET